MTRRLELIVGAAVILLVCSCISLIGYNSQPNLRSRSRLEQGELENITNATTATLTVSPYFQWETSMWRQRNIKANVTLNLDAFETALQEASANQCDLGITATVFQDDEQATQVFQTTVGSNYHDLAAKGNSSTPWISGWTGDTVFALYSNSKIFAAALFMAAVVDTGLGYLDEPMHVIFDDHLTPVNRTGRITPRMILSHRSGIQAYNRGTPDTDPLYSCIASANTTLEDCVKQHLLNDDVLENEPGSAVRYSNDPFYILAAVIVRKTGLQNIDDALQMYINEPLNMSATWDCPLVGSTKDKPHVSWGVCATGFDVPKLIQALLQATNTESNTTTFITPSSVKEMFSFQAGVAANADEPLPFNMPLNNCLSRIDSEKVNFLIGYGLGTMITAGVKGILYVHAATVGGYWVVSPGKYAAYFAFMKAGAFPSAYTWVARVIDRFERASSVFVGNAWDGGDENKSIDVYTNEVTPCIDGMFIDTKVVDESSVTWDNCPNVTR